MRLIDADALRDRLQNLAYDDWNQGVSTSWADAYRECADMVEEMPTIEERKTGRWKRTYLDHEAMGERPSIFYCSVCNQCIAYPVNYCPNCGADMRGV